MNEGFRRVIAASAQDRRDLFLAAARRLGTPLQNVEKDFWVCWALDLLFNGRAADEPRLLFKGGTSLSKAHGLISRFSEDIDITVFREDIGENVEARDLETLSGKQQRLRLARIRQACCLYIQGPLRTRLQNQIETLFREIGLPGDNVLILDPDDADRQTLLIRYPPVADTDDYLRPTIKIEAGARSALDPHHVVDIRPYVADDLPEMNLTVPNVRAIDAERTFWDKVVILHGLRRWFDHRGALRHQGHRVSRHYYDVCMMFRSPPGERAARDRVLAADCVRHARMFFNSADLDLASACPGSFALTPTPEMAAALKSDYRAMAGMIFGAAPDFSAVLDAVERLEQTVNQQN
ncbi:MAG: nucleotidyl transferase AbiEii/AbiGii toxin family protein [Azoarcus sp.]|jgi:hypothetical protein|nr:nucleotidyl transferase AbiEii/AbiGii toxin family protein [Azoarcus sp.]